MSSTQHRPKILFSVYAPRLAGYPKIHKTDVPLRGVVSFIRSPYENIARSLVPILKSLQGRSGNYIKNGRELKETIKSWKIRGDEILVSYDVEKLYPSIPIKRALELIECLLKCKSNLLEVTTFSIRNIMRLLKWIFNLTYCEYGGLHYVLDCGPIGLSVVGEVAIIYMEDFQIRARSAEFPELNAWPWYVDDSVLKCKKDKATKILDHINGIEPDCIKFTKEEEENDKLSVLDLELNVNREKEKVEFNVHYKKTNTNIMIKKKSNHTEQVKQGVIKGFTDRARAYCDPKYLSTEMENIIDVFVDNGYSKEEVKKIISKDAKNEMKDKELEHSRGIVTMPNIPNLTPKFNRIAKKHKFIVVNGTSHKVKDIKNKAKTPLGQKNTNIVYSIPCGCKKYEYIGETDRKWETRKKEHQDKIRLMERDLRMGNKERAEKRMNDGDGGLAKHSSICSSNVDWDNSKIIGKEQKWTQRKYLEGIESLRQKNRGITPLNNYNKMEQWKPILYSFFNDECHEVNVT